MEYKCPKSNKVEKTVKEWDGDEQLVSRKKKYQKAKKAKLEIGKPRGYFQVLV